MTVVQLLFYVFASVAVCSGVMVVASKHPIRSVLFLVLAFVSTAGIWMLLNAEFLALILVLVYVGAVMTLFLFVVMMLSLRKVSQREGFVRYLPLCAIIVLLVVGLIILAVGPQFGFINFPAPTPKTADYSNIANLGAVLYTEYAYPFEIAAVILLTSIVAAIALTHHKTSNNKQQNIADQISVRREDRVRLVNMETEKKKP